ncbi:MAG: hypothetical protein PHY48_09195 [Candidatus Cloacimonetes bacterium]|nr:hypothetical protein [Candidatus Cloacimonadota bacterium]
MFGDELVYEYFDLEHFIDFVCFAFWLAGLPYVDPIPTGIVEHHSCSHVGFDLFLDAYPAGILIEAEGEEYITAKDRVKALGRNLFDFLNFAPIDKVKLAFAGMPIPSVPIPANIGSYYASGGSISGRASMDSIMDTIVTVVREEFSSLKQSIVDNKPNIEIKVDPLSNDPVRVSEIADTGKLIRSEV